MAETAATAGGEARVVESADLMPKVIDFLGMGDKFTGNARAVVSKVWSAAADKTKPRMTLSTFNGISASCWNGKIDGYYMHAISYPPHEKRPLDFFEAEHEQAVKDAHPEWKFPVCPSFNEPHDYATLFKEMCRLYDNLDPAAKQTYEALAAKDEKRCARQQAAYYASEMEEEELKDILVGHAPAKIIFERGVAYAPTGGWTVGTLFDAIAKGHPGYGDHTFFEGMYSQGNGYYGVMYGS